MKGFFSYHFNPEVHALLLRDEGRVLAFQKAIEKVIKQGDIVVDIGTGTGILAFLCLRAGAKRVYAIEKGRPVHLARVIAETNHISEQVSFIKGSSFEVSLPEKVDGIVTETIGKFGLEEGIIEILYDAKRRFLKEDGWIIPERLRLLLAPASLSEDYKERIFIWTERPYDIDFSPAMKWALNSYYYIKGLRREYFLGEPQILYETDLQAAQPFRMKRFIQTLSIMKEGMLHGFVGWFEAILNPGISLSTEPYNRGATWHWHNLFFPISPVHVESGDRIEMELLFTDKGIAEPFVWRGTVLSPEGIRKSTFSHMSMHAKKLTGK